MASKARQSLLGGLFALSLNLVIFPFFMRLRSSGGYDAHNVAPYRVSDEEHSVVDQTNGIKTQLAGGIEVIELDHVRVQKHAAVRKSTPCFLRLACSLVMSHSNSIASPDFEYTDIQ